MRSFAAFAGFDPVSPLQKSPTSCLAWPTRSWIFSTGIMSATVLPKALTLGIPSSATHPARSRTPDVTPASALVAPVSRPVSPTSIIRPSQAFFSLVTSPFRPFIWIFEMRSAVPPEFSSSFVRPTSFAEPCWISAAMPGPAR